MSINVVYFWPFDIVGTTKTRKLVYSDQTGIVPSFSSVFSYDTASRQLVCADFDADGVWQDDWRMTYNPLSGVGEVADWYPQKNKWLAGVFGPVQKENLSVPIQWGNVVNVGQVISNSPTYNSLTSTPPFCVGGSGFQAVAFEALLPSMTLSNGDIYYNVLQMMYEQTWNGKTTGARYWMAEGVGPIAISWLAIGPGGIVINTEPRCDAVVTNS